MNLEKSQIKYLLILALLALTLPMAAWLVSRPQLIQKQAACAVNLKLVPAVDSHPRNTPFDVALKIEAGTVAVTGADVNLSFDASKIKINSITLGTDLSVEIVKTINNTNGTARIVAVKTSGAGVTGNFNLATLWLEGLVAGSASVAVSLGNAQITASGEGAACTVTKTNGAYTITAVTPTNTPVPGQPTPTPTRPAATNTPVPTGTISPTPTPTGGAGRAVTLKVKLKGVNSQPSEPANRTLNFKVKFVTSPPQAQVGPVYTASGSADAQGIWTMALTTQGSLGPGAYDIYIKGPKHLQKKFPQVLFSAGTTPTTVDLTDFLNRGVRYYLDPGDLAISGTNHDQQDGVVDARDAVYLTSTCGLFTEDATCLAKADLDLDGQINAIDIALMNATVYSKWEDEVE